MRLDALSAAGLTLCSLVGCSSVSPIDVVGGHPDAASSTDTGAGSGTGTQVHDGGPAYGSSDSTAPDAGGDDAAADTGPACGDPQTDPRNCGSCGHDCNGGACESASCVPLPPGVLATGQPSPSGVVVDATDVYWINLGNYHPSGAGPKVPGSFAGAQVMKCAKTGCGNRPTVLATGNWQFGGVPAAIAVDASNVFWAVNDQIFKCLTSGCGGTPTAIWSGQAPTYGIALHATNAYVTTGADVQVMQCAKSGCGSNPSFLWSGLQQTPQYFPQGIVVDGTIAYFAIGDGLIMRCATAGCGNMPEHFWTGVPGSLQAATSGIAVDATNVYWTNSQPVMVGQVMQCAKGNCSGTVTTLAGGLSSPSGIAIDGANVYFTQIGATLLDGGGVFDGPGQVMRCAIGGCGGQPASFAGGLRRPLGIALDATTVYWAESGRGAADGQIVSQAK